MGGFPPKMMGSTKCRGRSTNIGGGLSVEEDLGAGDSREAAGEILLVYEQP